MTDRLALARRIVDRANQRTKADLIDLTLAATNRVLAQKIAFLRPCPDLEASLDAIAAARRFDMATTREEML
ncbi:MAG: hypothetical protein IT548_06970 [Alphaproteobacteria bacterium]|nr:hypothetical protein [Alphaproteobacteria bacterium]